ncbi:MAG: dTDP-glucose 4,6-dehydratase [Candidatus Latescibacterota bacterium]
MIAVSETDLSSSAQFENTPGRPTPLASPDSILQSLPDMRMNNWLVTGGAGFVGSNFVMSSRTAHRARIFNFDKLSSAANLSNLEKLREDQDHVFIKGDIRNRILVQRILHEYMPNAVINFAAECANDHTFLSPESFVQTNVLGTFSLLEEVRQYWESIESGKRGQFRFLHISSAEVYGDLGPDEAPRAESAPYNPKGVFAASKAACDHLVRAYHRAYGLPVLIAMSDCNFGPYQFPYEPVPRIILDTLDGEQIPLLGNGKTKRDWLHVDDFNSALLTILERGMPGETYHVSAAYERTDREMIQLLCDILDDCRPESPYRPHRSLIAPIGENTFNCHRYGLDASKIRRELGWQPRETLESGLRKSVRWYLENLWWVNAVRTGEYRSWVEHRHMVRGTGAD